METLEKFDYFTINPSFRVLGAIKGAFEREKAIKALKDRGELSGFTNHEWYNAQRMADSGAGWVMITRDEDGNYFEGWNSESELEWPLNEVLDIILGY